MPSRYAILSGAVSLLALVAFASGASAAGKPLEMPTKGLITTGEGDLPISLLATVYSTGYEVANGFVVGTCEPQNGYTATGTNLPWNLVSAANPYAGSQHLRLVRNTAAGAGASHVLLTPVVPTPANQPSQIKLQVNISNDGGADYHVIGQAPSQGFLSWRVLFSWSGATGSEPGTIFILDDIGAGLAFQDTGVLWDPGVYRELKVQFDPAASEIRYFYDGNLIYTGFNIYAGTSVEQLVWLHDNFQLGGETGDFDAIDWIDSASDPVPATNKSWGGVKNLYR